MQNSKISNVAYIEDKRLHDFTIAVGSEVNFHDSFNPNNFATCAYVSGGLKAAETRLIPCTHGVTGRYIVIYFNRKDVLTLCEVEVYGQSVAGNVSKVKLLHDNLCKFQ